MTADLPAPLPLPADPLLAAVADAMERTGEWAWVMDDRFHLVHTTTAVRATYAGGGGRLAHFPIGAHFFGPEMLAAARTWTFGPTSAERMAEVLRDLGGWVVADAPGGADGLRRIVDPELAGVVDDLRPDERPAMAFVAHGMGIGHVVDVPVAGVRLRRADGSLAGSLFVFKPAASMTMLSALAAMADGRHFERMERVAEARRRPAAVLFADLEGSSALSRRLSTKGYFSLGRRLVRAADAAVIDAGGITGRHVGDGVVAFFPAELAGSESAAARSCIEAARMLREALGNVALRSELEPGEVVLRFGLHWGSTLFVGAVTTGGRSEVTALGDEVNEAARIEACATGGRTLASKNLLERLDPGDAAALGLDPDRMHYTALADLVTATEKARRDAPAISVADV